MTNDLQRRFLLPSDPVHFQTIFNIEILDFIGCNLGVTLCRHRGGRSKYDKVYKIDGDDSEICVVCFSTCCKSVSQLVAGQCRRSTSCVVISSCLVATTLLSTLLFEFMVELRKNCEEKIIMKPKNIHLHRRRRLCVYHKLPLVSNYSFWVNSKHTRTVTLLKCIKHDHKAVLHFTGALLLQCIFDRASMQLRRNFIGEFIQYNADATGKENKDWLFSYKLQGFTLGVELN